VQKTIAVDLQSLDFSDQLLTDLELHITKTAKEHDPQSFYLLCSIPGVGKILALVLRSEIHDIARFPRVQDFVSYARLVRCPKASAGKRTGSGNKKIGNVHLKWAFSEAACVFLRNNEPAQRYHTRLVSKHGKAKALGIIAHKLGRAVYYMLRRRDAFDPQKALCPA
jgi:transposase